MNTLRICTVALAILVSACSSSRTIRRETVHHRLLVKPGEAGEEITYTLTSQRRGSQSITRSTERSYKVASLGLTGRDITKKLGESVGLPAREGVMVNRVTRRTAAEKAGIRSSDVLMTFDGTKLSSTDQLKELIQEYSTPGATITITLLHKDEEGNYPTEPTSVEVTLDGVPEMETKSDTIKLDSDLGVFKLTGLQVGSLSDELATEMYGDADPVVLISDSLVGSPAYHAGFRTGDRVISCDGAPITSHRDISRAVLARSSKLQVPIDQFHAESLEGIRPVKGPIELVVDGPLGRHEGQMTVRDDMYDSASFNIPILFDCGSNIQRSRWSFLDFIFQFGANYRSKYRRSNSREPAQDTFLSILPLGMFEFESNEDYDKYCFLWIIEFKDRH